jgi:uncharacterized membrane protein
MSENTSPGLGTTAITEAEINSGKTMAILAYIIFLIPLFAARDNKFAMFHTQQAIVLWIVTIVLYIGFMILSFIISQISSSLACIFGIIMMLPWLVYIVLWIMGLINASQGNVKELPIIGQYGSKLNLVK